MSKLRKAQRIAISKQLDSKWNGTKFKDGIQRIRENPVIKHGVIQAKR